MLSLFSHLYQYDLFVPFLLRIVLGCVFLHWSYREIKTSESGSIKKLVGIFEGLAGALLIIGLWAQGAALFGCIDLLVRTFGRLHRRAFLTDGVNYYLILLVLALSLIVTGPGLFAKDILGL